MPPKPPSPEEEMVILLKEINNKLEEIIILRAIDGKLKTLDEKMDCLVCGMKKLTLGWG